MIKNSNSNFHIRIENLIKFITQKILFNTCSTYKKVSEYLFISLEDEKRFKAYYKKRFPKSFKYLPIVQFLALLSIFVIAYIDSQTYKEYLCSVLQEEPVIPANPKFYSHYIFGFCVIITIYEFVLSVYVTLNANSPVINAVSQIGKNALKAASFCGAFVYGYSYAPIESNAVSTFVHTKTPFGRGYDYTVGNYLLKTKGEIVTGALGHTNTLSAVQKYAPDSKIIDINILENIINDPEFKSKIRVQTSLVEKAFIGIPLFDIPSLPTPTNLESPDVLDLNNLTSDGSNSDTEESVTPVVKKSQL